MIILHTSDWHLGQKFKGQDRKEEHDLALNFIFDAIVTHKVDILIVSGDIFDLGSPPNEARKQYYTFLARLLSTDLRHVVITGGNHDSPSMLEAPKDLLQSLNMHIVAAADDSLENELICLKNKSGETECIVAAVPFLRDRDTLKNLSADELQLDRSIRLKLGVKAHFDVLASLASSVENSVNIPIVATGHLTVTGSQITNRRDDIYIGNIENIDSEMFSSVFDYVALGHIHRAQSMNQVGNIRYSGSIIPLSFTEIQDKKSVTIIEFEGKKLKKHKLLEIPTYRKLLRLVGSKDEIFEAIEKLDQRLKLQLEVGDKLKAWLEINVVSETMIPNLNTELNDFVQGKHVEIFALNATNNASNNKGLEEHFDMQLLENEETVFKLKCETKGMTEEAIAEVLITFRELKESMV